MRNGFVALGMMVVMFALLSVAIASWRSVGSMVYTAHQKDEMLVCFKRSAHAAQLAQRVVIKKYKSLITATHFNVFPLADGILCCAPASVWSKRLCVPGVVCVVKQTYTAALCEWRFSLYKRGGAYVSDFCSFSLLPFNKLSAS